MNEVEALLKEHASSDEEYHDLLHLSLMLQETDLSAESQQLDHILQNLLQKKRGTLYMKRLITTAAALLLVAVAMLTIPPLRTIAQQLLEPLFPRTADELITISYTPFTDADIAIYSTLDELQANTGFMVRSPSGLDTNDVIYEHNTVRNVTIQTYNTEQLFIRISQQPIQDANEKGLLAFSFDLEIAPETEIETVNVAGYNGQFVRGMWVSKNNDPFTDYVWSSRFWFFTLRWQDVDFIYEVQIMPNKGPIREEPIEQAIIDIATDMMN